LNVAKILTTNCRRQLLVAPCTVNPVHLFVEYQFSDQNNAVGLLFSHICRINWNLGSWWEQKNDDKNLQNWCNNIDV